MRWYRQTGRHRSLKIILFKLQPIVQAAFSSGSLTAACLNLTAVASVILAKRLHLGLRRGHENQDCLLTPC